MDGGNKRAGTRPTPYGYNHVIDCVEVYLMIVTAVTIFVKPEHVEDFIEATRLNHEGAVKEPGNVRFDVLGCVDDPSRFMLYEAYESEEAAARHKQTAHYLRWKAQVEPWMAAQRTGVAHRVVFPSDRAAW
jgi:autoinducer 2-degrading protein